MTLLGVGGAPAAPSISLGDNQANSTGSGTSLAVTVTTSTPNELIIVMAAQQSFAASGVSDNHSLTWTQRGTPNRFSAQFGTSWWAVAPTAQTYTITVSYGGNTATFAVMNAITVKGANSSTPYDTNVALPYTIGNNGGQSAAPGNLELISTTATNTFVYGYYFYDSTLTPVGGGSGWTVLQAGAFFLSQYKIFSSPQTTTPIPQGSTQADIDIGIGDAVKP